MEFIKNNEGFNVIFNNQKIIKHTENEPFIYVGTGYSKYSMSRGSFKIKEKVSIKKSLYLESYTNNSEGYFITMASKDKAFRLMILIKECNDRIILEFKNLSSKINRLWINLVASEEEHIYGCGETFSEFDLRGKKARIWIAEHQSASKLIKKAIGRNFLGRKAHHVMKFEKYETYYGQPTFVSSNKTFVHVDSDAYMDFNFKEKDKHELLIKEVPKRIIMGKNNSFEELLGNLTDLLGRQPKLPEWIYNGAILGIQGGTEIMKKKLDLAISRGMKVSGVWCQDWQGERITSFGKQLMWNWQWDKKLYPNLDKEIIEMKKRNIRFLGYINPFLAVEGDLYKEASAKGYVVKNKAGEDYMVTITSFPAAMVDLTNPNAFQWIKDVIKTNMIGLGLSGWMADFGEYLPVDAVLYNGMDGEIVHNTWPALWAKANRQAVEEAGKLGEVFFFTRAGHTETIKYSTAMWNGDQYVDWSFDDGLPSVIPATLSLAMSGFGLAHSDIGGYTTMFDLKRSKELFMRWAELAAFSPIMRSHEGNRPNDNIQFDHDMDTLSQYARMSRVYEKLSPYISEAVKLCSEKGIPVMRPIFMYYDEEEAYTQKYEYLLGRDLLVAPIYKEGATKRTVYLPNDEWVHLWTGEKYCGSKVEIEAPIGYPPVFYRKSSFYAELFEKIGM